MPQVLGNHKALGSIPSKVKNKQQQQKTPEWCLDLVCPPEIHVLEAWSSLMGVEFLMSCRSELVLARAGCY
jgi:hypothetical protein